MSKKVSHRAIEFLNDLCKEGYFDYDLETADNYPNSYHPHIAQGWLSYAVWDCIITLQVGKRRVKHGLPYYVDEKEPWKITGRWDAGGKRQTSFLSPRKIYNTVYLDELAETINEDLDKNIHIPFILLRNIYYYYKKHDKDYSNGEWIGDWNSGGTFKDIFYKKLNNRYNEKVFDATIGGDDRLNKDVKGIIKSFLK